MPLRGLIGSDILKYRDDWKVIDSPFGDDDQIVLLPAIKPDVALIHAPMADRFGNVWIGRQRELATMAHAAVKNDRNSRRKSTTATCSTIRRSRPGRSPAFTWRRVAVAERGAWPLGLPDFMAWMQAILREYARMAANDRRFCGRTVSLETVSGMIGRRTSS